ncbi:MAG: B12-binding domain-containing radical SAM protein [Nitrospirae bacterium]|nr:B12-binding domain-containing radical SAM protein [Nitrospirota bacterium]
MRVLFIFTHIHIVSPKFSAAVATLSSVAKRAGHTTSLLFVYGAIDEEYIRETIVKEAPDVIAITATTSQWKSVDKIGSLVKKITSVPIIFGGIHPTLCPDEVMSSEWIDALCIGEGEEPFAEYLDALEGRGNAETIKNLWVRVKSGSGGETIVKNPIRPPVKDIDVLPVWDYDLFGAHHFIGRNDYSFVGKPGFFPFATGRGCPYRCTYCGNTGLLDVYASTSGSFVRKHSVNYIITSMKALMGQYSIEGFELWDEMLSANEKWLEDFCTRYGGEVGLPYVTALRVEHVNERVIKLLKDSGCFMLGMGVESGNEEYRKRYLNRKMSNQQLVDAFDAAKRAGIKTLSWNMIGMPFETAALIEETIEFNRRLRPDVIGVAVFEPLPLTPLRDLCVKEGLLSDREVLIFSDQSTLNQKTITQEELSRCYRKFQELSKELTTEKIDWT